MKVVARSGVDALRHLGPRLDALHEAANIPITARRTWLQAWAEAYPAFEPLAISIEDEAAVQAVALLATRRSGGLGRIVACGHGPSDAVALPSRNRASAVRLAQSITEALGELRDPWQLVLRHILPADDVAPLLAGELSHARLIPGDIAPVLHTQPGSVLGDHVSSSHRRGIARVRNRMVRAALKPEVRHLDDPAEIDALIPSIERIYRLRDEALKRRCALDVRSHRDFFRLVTRRHAESGQVRLTTLDLEGHLAAYVLCFKDGPALRMWNCRFDPGWERYSPGKLAMEESVADALVCGFTTYDFMRGAERYKSSYANGALETRDLHAASGAVLAGAVAVALTVRDTVRRVEAVEGRGARLVAMTRRLQHRWVAR